MIDRGDGPLIVGGGPMDPVGGTERQEVRSLLARLGLTDRLPSSTLERTAPGADATSRPPGVARPVVVAAPSDALRAAADSVFDRGWTSRLGYLMIREPPAAAAERFLARVEELVVAENLTDSSRTKGVAVFAMTTLGLPEGVDEGPALAAFLTRAQELVRRREMSVTLARTSGALGSARVPSGGDLRSPVGQSHRRSPRPGARHPDASRHHRRGCARDRVVRAPHDRGRGGVHRGSRVELARVDHVDGDSRAAGGDGVADSK